jgi:hypothetical protein
MFLGFMAHFPKIINHNYHATLQYQFMTTKGYLGWTVWGSYPRYLSANRYQGRTVRCLYPQSTNEYLSWNVCSSYPQYICTWAGLSWVRIPSVCPPRLYCPGFVSAIFVHQPVPGLDGPRIVLTVVTQTRGTWAPTPSMCTRELHM